ncbi:uncharacterized protein [Periplaneta americana]|uniref:uncharacterized protein isoform X5 n=1 Tax=Periplaneta americana TaxID=6978 RepID=UPI0037E800D7
MEPEIDLPAVRSIDATDKEEKNNLLQEGNLLNLQVTQMKVEWEDPSYDLSSEVKIEETVLPVTSSVSCEAKHTSGSFPTH